MHLICRGRGDTPERSGKGLRCALAAASTNEVLLRWRGASAELARLLLPVPQRCERPQTGALLQSKSAGMWFSGVLFLSFYFVFSCLVLYILVLISLILYFVFS